MGMGMGMGGMGMGMGMNMNMGGAEVFTSSFGSFGGQGPAMKKTTTSTRFMNGKKITTQTYVPFSYTIIE